MFRFSVCRLSSCAPAHRELGVRLCFFGSILMLSPRLLSRELVRLIRGDTESWPQWTRPFC